MLFQEGYNGIIVRSFAKGTSPDQLNVVLWSWGTEGSKVKLVDDENRSRLN